MFYLTFFVIINTIPFISVGYSALLERLEIPLVPANDVDLFGQISVGTSDNGKPQGLRVLFDTGANHLWVVAPGTEIPGSHVAFDGEGSDTFSSNKEDFTMTYKDGEIKGYLGRDQFKVGEGYDAIVIQNQVFGLATKSYPSLYNVIFNGFDAIFGLNLVSTELMDGEPEPPLIKMSQQLEKVPLFGLYINRFHRHKSMLVLGSNHNGLTSGQFTTHKVVQQGGYYNGWKISVDKFAVIKKGASNEENTIDNLGYRVAQIRSGSISTIAGPREVMDKINTKVFSYASFQYDKKNKYHFHCDPSNIEKVYSSLPKVYIYMNGVKFMLRPYDYIAQDNDGCISTLIETDETDFTLGLNFMMKYYIRFDYDNKQVEIAKSSQDYGDIDF